MQKNLEPSKEKSCRRGLKKGGLDYIKLKKPFGDMVAIPMRPHALLTSGMHTKSVFNGNLAISDEDLLCEIASNLVLALQKSTI